MIAFAAGCDASLNNRFSFIKERHPSLKPHLLKKTGQAIDHPEIRFYPSTGQRSIIVERDLPVPESMPQSVYRNRFAAYGTCQQIRKLSWAECSMLFQPLFTF